MMPDPVQIRARPHRRPRPAMVRLVPLLAVLLTVIGVLSAQISHAAPFPDRAVKATLLVYSDDDKERFLGSALLWGDGTQALSNHHVVGARDRVLLVGIDGQRISAEVVRQDALRDLALIRVDGAVFGAGLVPAGFPSEIGDAVIAIGAPLEAEWTVTRGIISARARQVLQEAPVMFLQHDAAINPGSSGGPLVNAAGQLLGMNTRIADGTRLFAGIAYAIPAQVLNRFAEGQLPDIPRLGLTLRALQAASAAALGVPRDAGLLVDDVSAGSRADAAGLRAGDVLVAVDGHPLRRAGDLAIALDKRSALTLSVQVLRGRTPVVLTLDLSHRKAMLEQAQAVPVMRVAAYDLAALGVTLDSTTGIAGLTQSSPAYHAGLDLGDVVLTVNGLPATHDVLAQMVLRKPVLLLVRRGSARTLHVLVDPWLEGAVMRPMGGSNLLDPAAVIF